MLRARGVSFLVAFCLLNGCDDAPSQSSGGAGGGSPNAGGSGGEAGGHDQSGSTGGGQASSGGHSSAGGAGGGGAIGGSGAGGGPGSGLTTLGTLVVLGDSISDGGGVAPYYYDLLHDQLSAKYGAIQYRHRAESGSKTSALLGQIDGLPGQLPGPIAVTITSGGNDMKAALPLILSGTDAAKRQEMGQNISEALDALLEPGRFGAGVEVHVFEATIYDASDGQGDFGSHGCSFAQGFPAFPTDGYFDAWNGVIDTQLQAHAQPTIDVHALFYGHGYHSTPSWYAGDCTHPSAIGHAQLADHFYAAITGAPP